jgi:Set1/Ash2 histone methyltransferase complex subunit ASH2
MSDPNNNPTPELLAPVADTSSSALTPPPVAPHQYNTKGRFKTQASQLDPETQAAARQAVLLLSENFPGVSTLLQQQSSFLLDQLPVVLEKSVTQAALKSVQDVPPWVHWNKQDTASPPLKIDAASKLHLTTTQLRGYRMARATHGVKKDAAYFECVIGPFPTATEIQDNLPPNARLGPKLEEQLRAAVKREQTRHTQDQQEQKEGPELKKSKLDHCRIGGHVRLGFSMRTGDLQAPVGYDKWSYAISSVGGIVHASKRHEDWNQLYASEGDTENMLHPGDVVGCAIVLDGEENHIRFFQNGEGLGNFIIAKGKRLGGEAFEKIDSGFYYPAVSAYLGGSVRANFGPHWICPPRKLPPYLKKALEPISSLCSPPLAPANAIEMAQPAIRLFAKKEHQQALTQAVLIEAQIQCKAYEQFSNNQLGWIHEMRNERGMSVTDLPEPAILDNGDSENVQDM